MKAFIKTIDIRIIIILIVFNVVLIHSVKAQTFSGWLQNNNYQSTLCLYEHQLYSVKYRIPRFWHRDSIQIKPFPTSINDFRKNDYFQRSTFKLFGEKKDTLQTSLVYRRPHLYSVPTIEFQYTPSPTTWQGLGILFMGISRSILFPTAPDYKITPQ